MYGWYEFFFTPKKSFGAKKACFFYEIVGKIVVFRLFFKRNGRKAWIFWSPNSQFLPQFWVDKGDQIQRLSLVLIVLPLLLPQQIFSARKKTLKKARKRTPNFQLQMVSVLNISYLRFLTTIVRLGKIKRNLIWIFPPQKSTEIFQFSGEKVRKLHCLQTRMFLYMYTICIKFACQQNTVHSVFFFLVILRVSKV